MICSFFSDGTAVPPDGKLHQDPLDPNVSYKVLEHWAPQGVLRFIGAGVTANLGLCGDGCVLKYARDKDDNHARQALEVERQILLALGHHKRLVKYMGTSTDGLLFRYEANGDIRQYLRKTPATSISIERRLHWARQAAEAVSLIHTRGVVHSDIHPNNFLLDDQMNLRLCDFSGSLFGTLDGEAMESARVWLPRDPLLKPTVRTDLFALGSLIYTILRGHEPYETLSEAKVTDRFSRNEYPPLDHIVGGATILGCWNGKLDDAEEVIEALTKTQADLESGTQRPTVSHPALVPVALTLICLVPLIVWTRGRRR